MNGNSGGDGHDFDIKKLKKGHTVVVPNPRRHGVREGKQGYVRCVWGDLTVSYFCVLKNCFKADEES